MATRKKKKESLLKKGAKAVSKAYNSKTKKEPTKKKSKSIVQLATQLAKLKLKRKINKEKLKGMI